MFYPTATSLERFAPPKHRRNERPALAALALLAVANPYVAEHLLRDPIAAARSHPHYTINLDEDDCTVLTSIQARSCSIDEFLHQLADAIEDPR